MKQKAHERYLAMKAFDLAPVIAFAVRDKFLPDQETAEVAFDSLLQWLAAHAVDEHKEMPFVMMNGPVDEAYHAFMLNSRKYLQFCREYVGFFIHHTPVDDELSKHLELDLGIDYTIGYLNKAYGTELAPMLTAWKTDREAGLLTVTSVSCVRNGAEPAMLELVGIPDFRTFWDRNPQPHSGTA